MLRTWMLLFVNARQQNEWNENNNNDKVVVGDHQNEME